MGKTMNDPFITFDGQDDERSIYLTTFDGQDDERSIYFTFDGQDDERSILSLLMLISVALIATPKLHITNTYIVLHDFFL